MALRNTRQPETTRQSDTDHLPKIARRSDVRPVLPPSDDDEIGADVVVFGPALREYAVTLKIERIERGTPLIAPEDVEL